MTVTNINGKSDTTCKCGSWLAHWQNFSGQRLPRHCPETTCLESTAVGAHVQKAGSSDKKWYIIPLCKTHNAMTGGTITVGNYLKLVPADKAETCG